VDEAHDGGSTIERGGLGGAVLDSDAVDGMLQHLVRLAHHTVEKAHSVSITVDDGGRYRTSNSVGPEALPMDKAQYEADDGPCLSALRSAKQLQATIGVDTHRWPLFEERAREMGIVDVLSTPLVRAPEVAIGALNIYARRDGGFSEQEARIATQLGEHAAILVGNAMALVSASHLNEQLMQAVASREIIGEAKGIIMERQSCTRDEAFDILRRASQRENRKLRDLAEDLVVRVENRKREGRSGQ
jgi:GAF domain-containing protein